MTISEALGTSTPTSITVVATRTASAPLAQADAQLLLDRDGGLASPRGQAARTCLYLFERDQAVGLLRSG